MLSYVLYVTEHFTALNIKACSMTSVLASVAFDLIVSIGLSHEQGG